MADGSINLDTEAAGRLLSSLPDDPSKDTPAQKDLRVVMAWTATAALLLPSLGQAANEAVEAVKALFGGQLPSVEQP